MTAVAVAAVSGIAAMVNAVASVALRRGRPVATVPAVTYCPKEKLFFFSSALCIT